MSHVLQDRIRVVKRKARRLRQVQAIAFSLVALLGAGLLAGIADWVLRIEDLPFRVVLSAGLVVTLVAVVVRWLLPAWRFRESEVAIAQHVERTWPSLADRLSSAISFLQQPEHEPTAGSYALRRAVVAGTVAEAEGLDFGRSLDARRARRAAFWAAVVVLLTTGICVIDVHTTALAARRLAAPWVAQPWPRRHYLALVDTPTRVAVGSDVEFEVIDRNGRLPKQVTFQVWLAGQPEDAVQEKPMRFLGDRLVHRLENVRQPLRYRVSGGDDDTMPWISLQVADPPRIESLEIRLQPPDYTAWPIQTSGENIQALQGTRIEASGRLDRPAARVDLWTEPGGRSQVAIELQPDGRSFSIPPDAESAWRVQESCTYWFETTDLEGLRGADERRWSIRAVEDRPPTVSLVKPGANAFVTPDAVLALAGEAEDDLRLREIAIHFRRSDVEEHAGTVPLYQGPERMPPPPDASAIFAGKPSRQPLDFAWDLARLPSLRPGVWIDFEVVATDDKSQSGQSTTRRLTIIAVEELEERLAARQTYILGQLADILRRQQDLRSQVRGLQIQVEQTGRLVAEDTDRLQSTELGQREVLRLLADPNDGVESQIKSVLDELESNRLENPETQQRMVELLAAVEELRAEYLPAVQRGLLDALKVAREGIRDSDTGDRYDATEPLTESLATAGAQQDRAIQVLERLLGELSQWDSYRRFHRELHRLKQDQQQIRRDTDAARLDLLSRPPNDRDPEQRAQLLRVAERQQDTARRFDKIRTRMQQLWRELAEDDPEVAQILADTLDAARRTAVGGSMREGARRIESRRLGDALELQDAALEGLDELLAALSNRRDLELQRRVEMMQAIAGEIDRLRGDQATVNQRLADADESGNAEDARGAAEAQEQLAEQAGLLARRLERLLAKSTAEAVSQAEDSMRAATGQARQGDTEDATRTGAQAEQQLQDAAERLQAESRAAQQDLLFEQLAKLEQQIAGLILRQQAVLETTRQMEELLEPDGSRTRGQQTTIAELARQQRLLMTDTARANEPLDSAPVFQVILKGAATEMDRAARGLDDTVTGEKTQSAQQSALNRLTQLQQALKREKSAPSDSGSADPPDPPDPLPPSTAVQILAELKLLLALQEEIHRRTIEVERMRTIDEIAGEELEQTLTSLASEQGQLAELIRQLSDMAAGASAGAADPDESSRPKALPEDGNLEDRLLEQLEETLP